MADTIDRTVDDPLPKHIAIIMDGNGRWAQQQGLPRMDGHRKGVEAVKNIVPICAKKGISHLTLFTFSSENWRRPSAEVALLVDLLTNTLESEIEELHKHKIRLRAIGDLSRFPNRLQRAIKRSEELTRNNRAINLTIAINYGGQWDILQACRSIAALVEKGEIASSMVTPALIESQLCTCDLPGPDLFIRTGGEIRISNFLLWQLAYTELYFTETYWPDFNDRHLEVALAAFAKRQRRFGKIDSQTMELGQC